jgi:hypothetical protein
MLVNDVPLRSCVIDLPLYTILFTPVIGFHATRVGIPTNPLRVPGETLFCGPHGVYPNLSSKVVIP